MKRSIVLFLVLGMIFGSIASAEAAKKKKPKKVSRTVEGSYDAPALIVAGTCSQTGAVGCVAIQTTLAEKFLTASVTDQHGQAVYVSVQADTDGNNQDDVVYGSFCGETTEPIAVDPGAALHLWVGVTPDPAMAGCAPAAATSGTVSATLSNLP
jgi:hypothetical protein